VHVAHDLLKVRGGHCQDTGKLNRRNLNGRHIQLNQIQVEAGHHLFVTVLDLNAELGGVRLLHVEHNALVVGHGLHELEEVDHVDAENVLVRAVELIKAVGAQTQMDQDGVSTVHRHDLETGAVNLQIRICEDVFDCLGECAEGGRFYRANTEQQVGSIHSIGGFRSCIFRLARLAVLTGGIGVSALICVFYGMTWVPGE
jgi:hypothetical protein